MSESALLVALLAVVAVFATLARRLGVPYPILMVLGGGAIGLIPGVPRIELEPDLVFLLVLPPLLYVAAFFTSVRDFRANALPIVSLAIGLVLFTVTTVAVVAHSLVPEIGWPLAFALGAIVAPPDAIAATAVLQRLGVPRRLVSILEGESLLNDATALVSFRIAVAAALGGAFSPLQAGLDFAVAAAGGIAIGLAVGVASVWLRTRAPDTPVSLTLSLLTPYAAYLPAEALHVSGVLAAVTTGLYVGRRASRMMSSETRVAGAAVWQMVVFLLTGLVFVALGSQLPAIVQGTERSMAQSLLVAAAVVAAVIASRFVWMYATALVARLRRPGAARTTDPRAAFVLGWSGMRGAVSLAAALSLPLALPGPAGTRELLIFVTFAVILVTLVGQGLTLPWVISALGVARDEGDRHDEAHARIATTASALARLEQLYEIWPTHHELLETLKATYEHRTRHDDAHHVEPAAAEDEHIEHRKIRLELIETERAAAHELRDRGAISDEVLRRLERDLDLEELRMEA